MKMGYFVFSCFPFLKHLANVIKCCEATSHGNLKQKTSKKGKKTLVHWNCNDAVWY
jgi:hypothetical protein